MADPTYGPKVYKKPGGDELVVASGGKITVESGGAIAADGGTQAADVGALTVADGAGTNDGTVGAITADASVIAAVQELAAKINAIRGVLRGAGLTT